MSARGSGGIPGPEGRTAADVTGFAATAAAARLRQAASRGALAHALIVSGAGDRAAAARYAAAAYECVSDGERPCLRCAHCRKVLADIHPDVVFARDEAHKELSADVVRALRSDAFVRANEGARRVFIFEDCAALNEKGQNILLKTVEEGPPGAAFVFCAENSAALLPTIRSRCVELKLGAPSGTEDTSEAARELARERAERLCRLSAEGTSARRWAYLVQLENAKLSRDELAELFGTARVLIAGALLSLYGVPAAEPELDALLARGLDRRRLMALTGLLDRYRRDCGYNVGVGPTLGGFAAAWERVLAERDAPSFPGGGREGISDDRGTL